MRFFLREFGNLDFGGIKFSILKCLLNLNYKITLWHPTVHELNKMCYGAGIAHGLPSVKSNLRQASSLM